MIAVIYARVSSNSGRQDTERQVNELSAYARNNNIEVAKVFQDYVSGATTKCAALGTPEPLKILHRREH